MRQWFLLLILLLWGALPASAQPDSLPALDDLPDCGFTALAARDDVSVGAVVLNLKTGAGCVENLDTVYPVASVPKIFVLGAYLDKVMRGESDYGQQVEFTRAYLMGGTNDCLRDENVGDRIARGALSETMIACSDNAATWMLMDAIGWDSVTRYIQARGLSDVGTVIPYAEVDRLKLALIDPAWQDVPREYASRYLRRRDTSGLSQFFSVTPDYTQEERRESARLYFETYDYNTASPRAVADYLIGLRDDLLRGQSPEADVARAFFNTLMLTQRQFSAQALPGTVYTGAKNGFDTGLRAEVTFTLDTLDNLNRVPESIVIVFSRMTDFSTPDLQRASGQDGVLNDLMLTLSPRVRDVLYPAFSAPPVEDDLRITTLRLQRDEFINACWSSYRFSDFDETLVDNYESCLANTGERSTFTNGDKLTLGLVLRGVNREELRLTFVYTLPDGSLRSYQVESFYQNQVGFNWFHPVDQPGQWTLDVYVNLKRVATRPVWVN